MFVLEILIYILFAYIMYWIANRALADDSNGSWNKYWTYYVVFYTVIAAIRFNVGIDCLSYIRIFTYGLLDENRIDDEIIWTYLVRFIHESGLNAAFGLGICAFIQIYCIVKACNSCKYILITVPIIMFGSRYFLDLMAAVRQMTVACVFLWSCKFILEKKFLKYILTIILCSFFHHSALILIPAYFIIYLPDISKRRKLMLIIFGLCFLAGQTPSFSSVIIYVQNLTNLAGYESYQDRVGSFLGSEETAESLAFGPMMLSYLCISVFIIWEGAHLKETYGEKIPLFNIWYFFSFFFACAYFLVYRISHIFIRPVQYFELFQMVMGALLLYDLLIKSKFDQYAKCLYVGFVLVIWTNTSWDIIKNYNLPNNFSTYKTIFFNEDLYRPIYIR